LKHKEYRLQHALSIIGAMQKRRFKGWPSGTELRNVNSIESGFQFQWRYSIRDFAFCP
jgi:hypothetical protein